MRAGDVGLDEEVQSMLLGVIADDFTGAGDIANTLALEGMRARLFIGPESVAGDCDAGVVALKSRSIPAHEAVAQSLTALDRLLAQGCRQFVFKYCSTFDSTPEGNIGPVAEALADALGARGVIVCPAFPATGRTVYQGHLFVGDRLLSESGMQHHPLTPMPDPDLRRWLSKQSQSPPGHLDHAIVARGAAAISHALASNIARLVVVDAICDDDLRAIGTAAADAPLITGGSGIALGLPDNFRRAGMLVPAESAFQAHDGPALILSGSCSATTQAQVAQYRSNAPAFEISIDGLMDGEDMFGQAEAFISKHRDDSPLIYSTASPDEVRDAQRDHGATRTAEAVELLFGELARRSVGDGFTRLVIAGGETSGAVVGALGIRAFDVGPQIDPGAPALSAGGVALALKSGNFGAPDFFEKALRVLGDG